MVGRTSVWSEKKSPPTFAFLATPGPTRPSQVAATSGCTPPWFQANVWFGGATFGKKTQLDRSAVFELFVQTVGVVVSADALRK